MPAQVQDTGAAVMRTCFFLPKEEANDILFIYLHIKVINVQSGKVIGSSIWEGRSEKDFLAMCNGAVEPLF